MEKEDFVANFRRLDEMDAGDEVEWKDEKAETSVVVMVLEREGEVLTTTQEQDASEVEVTPHLESLTTPLTWIRITVCAVYHCILYL